MSQIEQLATMIFSQLLKLYPAAFQADFGEEMQTVFKMVVEEAAQTGDGALLTVIGREVRDMPLSIIREHQRQRALRQTHRLAALPGDTRQVRRARLLIRLAGTALSTFMLFSLRDMLSPGYNIDPRTIPFPVFLFVASVGMLLALRWERAGGVVTMFGGVGMGVFIAAYLHSLSSSAFTLLGMVLVGTLWTLPFVIFGMLFYKLGRYQCPAGLSAG